MISVTYIDHEYDFSSLQCEKTQTLTHDQRLQSLAIICYRVLLEIKKQSNLLYSLS